MILQALGTKAVHDHMNQKTDIFFSIISTMPCHAMYYYKRPASLYNNIEAIPHADEYGYAFRSSAWKHIVCLSSISSGRRDPGGMRIELELILIFECLKVYIHKTAQVHQLQYA